MRTATSKSFDKAHTKLPKSVQKKFQERRNLFLENQFHPLLENHALHGDYSECRSINITGDYRAIFKMIAPDFAYFIDIGTHTRLYH